MPSKQIMMVTSRPLPGREKEYRDWYVECHIGEVLGVPGFLAGELHRCAGPDGQPTGQYRAIYEVEAQDPAVLMGALMAQAANMKLSDAMDPTSVEFTFLTPA